jgi:hypothetical protein
MSKELGPVGSIQSLGFEMWHYHVARNSGKLLELRVPLFPPL